MNCINDRQSTLICLLLTLWVATTSLSAADDLPAGVVDTQDPADIPLTPSESLRRITVPDGFQVTLFAGEPDVRRPIAFDFDDRGRLWVIENYSHPAATEGRSPDRILIFEDIDNDGRFDKRKVFWDQGRYLSAIAYGHGGVWVGNTPELSFIPDRDGDDVPDSEPVVLLDGFQVSSNNVLNNFHWGPDGWLYGAIGLAAKSTVGKPGTPPGERVEIPRGIWRMHPVTHKFEVQAIGMVNPWGADFNQFGDLITSNTVISHLWHIVPGMYVQRRGNEQDYRYAYGRIQSISDHLHWGSGQWQNSRVATPQHSVAGGGHAHCGAMVYLGDNWPDKYRGTFFTCNLHGNRVNNDILVPYKSTYIGTHGADFLFGNDPWFRGLTIKYGPDGGVYVSDWHDFGECHDSDGSHRTSGRIYKIVYGDPPVRKPFDLASQTVEELVALQSHRNAWYARHARRILQERSTAADAAFQQSVQTAIRQHFVAERAAEDSAYALPVLWTKYVTNGLGEGDLCALGSVSDEHVRRWAVRLLVDQNVPGLVALAELHRLAAEDPSAKVRLAVAVALQRIPPAARWSIAQALLSHAEDADDPYLPLMIWYGVEPLVEADLARSLQLAAEARIPLVRQYIARRALDTRRAADNQGSILETVVQTAWQASTDRRIDYLRGMRDALEDRGQIEPPPSWPRLYDQVSLGSDSASRSVAVELARIFGDRQAITELRNTVTERTADTEDRRTALRALLKLDQAVSATMLHALLGEKSELRTDALQALILNHDETTPDALLRVFSELTPTERQAAVSVLVSRSSFVPRLLEAIQSDQISRRDVSAYSLQQLRSYQSQQIQTAVAAIWSDSLSAKDVSKADEVARYKDVLTAKYLASGDASGGRRVFAEHCAKCHTLFGTGGDVGPDLTGSGRANLDYVLSNLVDPSALVDGAYRLTTVEMKDGRLLSGFLQRHGEYDVVLRTQDAEVTLKLFEIDNIQTTDRSMMPDGLLPSFTDEQIRDLVVYLASPEQVPLPLVE